MIWLTGYKGLLGSEIFNILTKNNIEFLYSDVDLDLLDLDKLLTITNNMDISCIINCVGLSSISACEEDPEKAYNLNVTTIQNLVEVAKSKNAKIIHICTESVFYGDKYDSYTEEDLTNPKNFLGSTKLQGTTYLQQNYDKYCVLRTSNLYSRYGVNYVYSLIKLLGSGSDVEVVDDIFLSPTYALDLAKVIVYLISQDKLKYGLYNCANIGNISWFDYSKIIFDKSIQYNILPSWIKKKSTIVPVTSAEYSLSKYYPQYSSLDCKKLQKDFGIIMRSFDQSIDHFFRLIKR